MQDDFPRSPKERGGLRLVFDEDFDQPELNLRRWSPYYLPHWSAAEPEQARYIIEEDRLVLRVDGSQPPWCPEYDGQVRVSALQTGQFSGPAGSSEGQHRFRDGLVVRRQLPAQRLFTSTYADIVIRARAHLGPTDLASLYLIGFEQQARDSGEITVFEIFGRNVDKDSVVVGRGIKAIRDPRLRDEFFESAFPIRIDQWHEYAISWRPDGVRCFLDGQEIGRSLQSPNYPMQLMLTCYRLEPADEGAAPPLLEVDYVRGYELASDGLES